MTLKSIIKKDSTFNLFAFNTTLGVVLHE